MKATPKREREVADIGGLTRDDLVARWVKTYGCAPPKGIKRGLLERSAAWHLQARRLGGHSADTRKLLRTDQGSNSTSVKSDASGAGSAVKSKLQVGTRLVRQWNGRNYIVDVTDEGYSLDGKTYRSLSAIARRITGTHWSGPRFFGR